MDRDHVWEQFVSIAQLPDAEIDLARASLLISATEEPQLDIEHQLGLLDSLAAAASRRLGTGGSTLYCANTLSEYLFEEVGFRGNEEDYYDPRNSFLDQVLLRRLGIPITLSLVYIEVGKRLGLPMVGVGMPGHFLIRHRDEAELILDPFEKGIVLSEEECIQRFRQVTPPRVPWNTSHLEPIENREFIARMLRNLKGIYWDRKDFQRALPMVDRLVALEPDVIQERRDRGLVHYQLQNYPEALDDLEAYMNYGRSASDGGVHRLVRELRNRLGR
jgi:regulator of sirC expression with transglutaminase-like and TPR domain